MNTEDISMYTGLSIRSVECILACFRQSEDILIPKQSMKEQKKKLGKMELEVSIVPLAVLYRSQ